MDYIVVRIDHVPEVGEAVTAMIHRQSASSPEDACKEAARAANDLQAESNVYAVVQTGSFSVKNVTVRPVDWEVTAAT